MKLEDPLETWDFFSKSAGEAWVTKVDAFQTRAESVMNNYADTRSASSEKRARIDLLDLKEQREGEAHILFKSKIIRARLFYANPRPVSRMRLNQFLKVGLPTNRYLLDLQSRLQDFRQVTDKEQFSLKKLDESAIITTLAQTLLEHSDVSPIQAGVSALLALDEPAEFSETEEQESIDEASSLSEGELNVFTPLNITPKLAELISVDDPDQFNAAFLKKSVTQKQVALIEKVSGKFKKHANSIATEIVQDMALATHYPPALHNILPGAEVAKDLNKLLIAIQQGRARAAAEEKS